MLDKLEQFSFNHSDQIDRLYEVMTTAAMKAAFDSRGEQIRMTLNKLVDDLQAEIGASNIGMTPIAELGTQNKVKDIINRIIEILKSTVDGSSGADFISATNITGLEGYTVQALLESLKKFIDDYKLELNSNNGASKIKTSNGNTVQQELNRVEGVANNAVTTSNQAKSIAETANNRVNNIVSNTPTNKDAELVDMRYDALNNKNYETAGKRIDYITSQLAHIINKDNVINVMDYGAKCDGLTDDSVAFQNALNVLNTITTPNGQWKRVLYIPAKMRICSKITADFGQFAIVGNAVTNSLIWCDGVDAGLEIGTSANFRHEIDFINVYFKGNDSTVCPLKITKIVNLYFNRFHVSNWAIGEYGVKLYNCGLIFFNECTIEGGADIATNTANRHGIYLEKMDSILEFKNGNVWNLGTFITFNGTTQNVNIETSWIECVRTLAHFNCVDDMRYINIKIKGNTINIHNESGIVYTQFGFLVFNSTSTTNFYSSVFNISDNTIYLWDITGIIGNSLIYIPAFLSGSDVSISYDNNVYSGKGLNDLLAYLFYSATSAMSLDIHIRSCNLPRRIDYQYLSNYTNSIKALTLSANKRLTAPNGIYLGNYQNDNYGNIYYDNGNFYAGYAGTLKTLPKSSGVTISDSTATDITILKRDFNTLLSALRTSKVID